MRITRPGKVTDRIWMLGREESCVYIVKGDRDYAMLGGGMTYIIPDVMAQVGDFGIDPSQIRYLLIHHAHFDHLGIVPYLKKLWPWAKVAASRRAFEQLRKPKVINAIVDYNRFALAQEGMEDLSEEFGLDLEKIEIENVVGEGDAIDLGGLTLDVLNTPGHSSCSISVYMPEEKALSASDGGGVPYGDRVFASANSNFDLYRKSLERMSALDVEVHMAEHYGALTGEDGRTFMARSIKAADETRKAMEESLNRTGSVAETAREMGDLMADEAEGYFLPRPVIDLVMTQMAGFLARKMNIE